MRSKGGSSNGVSRAAAGGGGLEHRRGLSKAKGAQDTSRQPDATAPSDGMDEFADGVRRQHEQRKRSCNRDGRPAWTRATSGTPAALPAKGNPSTTREPLGRAGASAPSPPRSRQRWRSRLRAVEAADRPRRRAPAAAAGVARPRAKPRASCRSRTFGPTRRRSTAFAPTGISAGSTSSSRCRRRRTSPTAGELRPGHLRVELQLAAGSFWQQALAAPDQLRQRVKFVAVADPRGVARTGRRQPRPTATRANVDLSRTNAFGNYRQLLEAVATHPAMGSTSRPAQQEGDPSPAACPTRTSRARLMQLSRSPARTEPGRHAASRQRGAGRDVHERGHERHRARVHRLELGRADDVRHGVQRSTTPPIPTAACGRCRRIRSSTRTARIASPRRDDPANTSAQASMRSPWTRCSTIPTCARSSAAARVSAW